VVKKPAVQQRAKRCLHQLSRLICLSIPFLIEERLVPFTDNDTVLRQVVDREPSLSLSRSCLQRTLTQNNLQHETGHVLAHIFLSEVGVGDLLDDLGTKTAAHCPVGGYGRSNRRHVLGGFAACRTNRDDLRLEWFTEQRGGLEGPAPC